MRILLLNYEYPPLGGGAGVATQALAHGLARRGAEVDVVTATPPGVGSGVFFEPDPRGFPGRVTVHRVKAFRSGVHQSGIVGCAVFVVSAVPVVRRLLQSRRPHVTHFFFSLPTGALLPLAVQAGIPSVVSLRGSDVPGYDPTNRELAAMHRLLRSLTRWIWRRADRVVPVCDSLGRLARETDRTLRYTPIRNGVDLDLFRPAARPHPARVASIRCVAVSRLVRRKGIRTLLDAFALLPAERFSLDVLGSGQEEEAMRGHAERLRLGPRVRFHGAVDRVRLAEFYREADLFTLVPWHEAFGNVFAEALAAGLPVVGSRIGGIPELIEHGTNGFLVPPGDPRALADAVTHLADRPEIRAAMSRANRARAEATLDWERATQSYLDLYESIIVPPSALRP